ncbi:MAG: DNA cytosine methyltransferase [Oscillospiraceae bacterium]|nr:DNA cytosine methyltransferase [Oscillospiraceae bacterium]
MQRNAEAEQLSLFGPDTEYGRTSLELSPADGTPSPEKRGRERTSKSSSSPSSKLKNHTFMLLDLRPGAGNMLGPCWEYDPVWLGSLGTLNTSECPSDVVESSLSQILLDTVPSKYYSSQTACRGILRRSEERGKELPKKLKTALMVQAGLCSLDELSELNAEADSDSSDGQDTENIKFSAGFSAGAGSSAGSIAYSEQIAPTLKGSASGNCMPSVLCLNDQGGSIMECSENISGTLRSQEHGHQPLVLPEGPALYENHGIDARYRGPLSVAPTLPARAGTGGNNLSLVAQPKPASSRQVYARHRSDAFRETDTAGTQSARQSKDATDVVLEQPFLIRRLVPIECERLQGYPDGWTDVPGASDSARYRALGNSLAIPCVEYLIRRITLALLLGFQGYF